MIPISILLTPPKLFKSKTISHGFIYSHKVFNIVSIKFVQLLNFMTYLPFSPWIPIPNSISVSPNWCMTPTPGIVQAPNATPKVKIDWVIYSPIFNKCYKFYPYELRAPNIL